MVPLTSEKLIDAEGENGMADCVKVKTERETGKWPEDSSEGRIPLFGECALREEMLAGVFIIPGKTLGWRKHVAVKTCISTETTGMRQ